MTDKIIVKVDDNGLADRLGMLRDDAPKALRQAMGKVGTEGRKTMRSLEPYRTGALKAATRKKAQGKFGQVIYIGSDPNKPVMRDRKGVHTPALYGIFEDVGTVKNTAHHYSDLTAGYLDAAAPVIITAALDERIAALDLS